MFPQVYLHRVRRIYDIHLKDFLQAWLPGGRFSLDLEAHLGMTDNEARCRRVLEASTHHVFVAREVFDDARKWKDENLAELTEPRVEEDDDPDHGEEAR